MLSCACGESPIDVHCVRITSFPGPHSALKRKYTAFLAALKQEKLVGMKRCQMRSMISFMRVPTRGAGEPPAEDHLQKSSFGRFYTPSTAFQKRPIALFKCSQRLLSGVAESKQIQRRGETIPTYWYQTTSVDGMASIIGAAARMAAKATVKNIQWRVDTLAWARGIVSTSRSERRLLRKNSPFVDGELYKVRLNREWVGNASCVQIGWLCLC